jgi:hypothetical protein
MVTEPLWELRITRRCLQDDLHGDPDASGRAEEHLDLHPIVRAFVERRGQSPIGQEPFACGTEITRLPLFTLHSNDDRGATWHQRSVPPGVESDYDLGIVWLLGVRPAHDYDGLCALGDDLLPRRDDAESFLQDQQLTFARALIEDVPQLIAVAEANRGTVVDGVLAGGIRVRVHRDAEDEAPLLTVAISSKPLPGTVQLAKNWFVRLLSAFFADGLDDLALTNEIGGEPLRPDESAYCCFAR